MSGDLTVGSIIADRYELIGRVGAGGMGVVWRARDRETGRTVAVKLVHGGMVEDTAHRQRFTREIELASRVELPRVVQVLAYGAEAGVPYVVLEYVEGQTLRDRLTTHGPYSWADVRPLLIDLARSLGDVHATGVIHRDIKPSNVMVTDDGRVKLADFGIARAVDQTRMTGPATIIGTPAYLAPEGDRDERSDLYALGVVAYELLTGSPPFVGETTSQVILAHVRTPPDLTKLPKEARQVVGWLLQKDPVRRPASAWALLAALGGPQTGAQTMRLQGQRRDSVARMGLVGIGSVGALILLILGVRVLTQSLQAQAAGSPTSSQPSLSVAPTTDQSAVGIGTSMPSGATSAGATAVESVSGSPVAGSDYFASAPAISVGFKAESDTTTATVEQGEPNPSNCLPAHDSYIAENTIWYQYTAQNAGPIEVDATSRTFDPSIAVFGEGPPPSNGPNQNQIKCGYQLGALTQAVSFVAKAQQTYWIQVGGSSLDSHTSGVVDVTIKGHLPANDYFASAPAISVGFKAESDTTTATVEQGEPNPSNCLPAHDSYIAENTIWYQYTAQNAGPIEVDATSRTFDPSIAVFGEGPPPSNGPNQNQIKCGYQLGALTQAVSFVAKAQQTYWIQVGGSSLDSHTSGVVDVTIKSSP